MTNENWPTYVLLALYVVLMTIVSIIANIQKRQDKANMVSSHFLASKNFGSIILFMTTFASLYSGYTVVGIPNEAGNNGFTALRWLGGTLNVVVSLMLLFPRLRRLCVVRCYESPGDFITDRYRSISIKLLVVFCLCIPQLLYFAVQLHSLGSTLSALTSGELDFYWIIVIASALIFIFEIIGGMRSVGYTDAIQAVFMIIVFLIIPIILGVIYGGYTGQIIDPYLFQDGQHCPNSNNNSTGVLSGCLNYATQPVISKKFISDQYFLRKPSGLTSINYLLFSLSLISFGLNPHIMQRAFCGSRDWNLKVVLVALAVTPLFAQLPQTLLGISFISNFPVLKLEYKKFGAFQATLAIFRDNGGFQAFISYVALLAGIAGIMSTADSALIGVSNTVSVDIFKDWLLKMKSEKYIVYIGKLISLIMIGISIGLACSMQSTFVNTGKTNYGTYLLIQQGILFQAFPAYIFGLYTNIHKYSILVGLIVGVVINLVLIILGLTGNDPFTLIDPVLGGLDTSWTSIAGVFFNLIFCGITQAIISYKYSKDTDCNVNSENHDNTDDTLSYVHESTSEMADIKDINPRFHGLLTYNEIQRIMSGIDEPITKFKGLFLWIAVICSVMPVFHWIGAVDPELKERFGDEVRGLLYNGKYSKVISGLPDWALLSIIWFCFGVISCIIAAIMWTVDKKHSTRHTTNNTKTNGEHDDTQMLNDSDNHDTTTHDNITAMETESNDLL